MALFASDFWNRIDELKGDIKLTQVAKTTGINYQTLRNQRSENRYPKKEDMEKLASYLSTTVEYLMTGTASHDAPHSENWNYVAEAMEEDEELAQFLAYITRKLKGKKL